MEERVWQAKKAKKQKYKVLSQIVTVALVIVKGSRTAMAKHFVRNVEPQQMVKHNSQGIMG